MRGMLECDAIEPERHVDVRHRAQRPECNAAGRPRKSAAERGNGLLARHARPQRANRLHAHALSGNRSTGSPPSRPARR